MIKRASMYQRPNKPMLTHNRVSKAELQTVEILKLAEPVAVDAATQCHVTPPAVAARMVAYAGKMLARDVLEPSAGTGNIARAILNAGADPERLALVEMHLGLASRLDSFGCEVHGRCFIEQAHDWRDAGREFQKILINPPFRTVRAHIAAAESLLSVGGCLVALVPVTFSRAGYVELERLPVDTFASAKVHTKILRFEK